MATETQEAMFDRGLRQLGLSCAGPGSYQYEQFLRYRQELLAWNARVNLTAITDPGEILIKHFLDSLSVLMAYDGPQARLLDIGAGAGFPGLPLKLVRPRWSVVLLEATAKKVAFLEHIIGTLPVEETRAVHARAEELAHRRGQRMQFDVVTARAVASLPRLLEYAAPFCRVGGRIVLLKKGELAEELEQGREAARELGAVLQDDIPVTLPGLGDGRRLLVWEQRAPAPAQFPRAAAAMARRALGAS